MLQRAWRFVLALSTTPPPSVCRGKTLGSTLEATTSGGQCTTWTNFEQTAGHIEDDTWRVEKLHGAKKESVRRIIAKFGPCDDL